MGRTLAPCYQRLMPTKILSWNVNGLRSVSRFGFKKWFAEQRADVVFLQEIKCTTAQVPSDLLNPFKYSSYWLPAERPGYSGVAAYCKKEPIDVRVGLGKKEFDLEGRVMALEFSDFIAINAYFPHARRDLSVWILKSGFAPNLINTLSAKNDAAKPCSLVATSISRRPKSI